MTKKKIEIIDDDDNYSKMKKSKEWKEAMESLRKLAEADEKYKKEAFTTPVKFLKDDLEKAKMFINILIKRLDKNFYDTFEFAECEEWYGADMFKDIQVRFSGDGERKELTLFKISELLTSLDYITRRLLENEYLEMKTEEKNKGYREKITEEYYKRVNKSFSDFCEKSKYHQGVYEYSEVDI